MLYFYPSVSDFFHDWQKLVDKEISSGIMSEWLSNRELQFFAYCKRNSDIWDTISIKLKIEGYGKIFILWCWSLGY